MWLTMILCSGMMIIYVLSNPNVGTIYRERYGFIMILVAMGIAGGIHAWQMRQKRCAAS